MIEYLVFSLSEMLTAFNSQDKLIESFTKFSCPREQDLENFLRGKAIKYQIDQSGKTFLIIDKNKFKEEKEIDIIAFFTTAQKALDISEITSGKRKKLFGYYPNRDNINAIPGYLIGQLGRSDQYTHDDLPGKIILQEAYKMINKAREIVGGKLVFLECRERMFGLFYASRGFKKINKDPDENGNLMLCRKMDNSQLM